MTGHSILNRIALLAVALVVGISVYFNVPPPRQAKADFGAASAWAGTAGGTANALVLNVANVQSLGDLVGVPIRFNPAANDTGPTTIAVHSLAGTTAPTAVLRPSSIGLVAFSRDEFWAGETTSVTYNGSTFVLTSNVDMRPIGSTCEFRGSGAPRGCIIEDGSCVSASQFAALNTVIGTLYGTCAGLQLPLSNGTAFVAFDAQGVNGAANRVTTASCATPNSPIFCGSQLATLTAGLVPNLTSSASNNITVTPAGTAKGVPVTSDPTNVQATNVVVISGTSVAPVSTAGIWGGVSQFTGANTITVATQGTGGSSVSHPVQNPMLPGIRAIKF